MGIANRITTTDCPFCAACSYGKQTITSTQKRKVTFSLPKENKHQPLNTNRMEPGSMVAVDQFEVAKKGRLFSSAGREHASRQFSGGTIFYDPASKTIKTYFQVSLNAAETIASKCKFEQFMADNGRDVKHYRTDNGIFTKRNFCSI